MAENEMFGSTTKSKDYDVRSAPFGERVITSLFDSKAHDQPNQVFASIPIDDDDLSKGFHDIKFSEVAGAVNEAAHWLDSTLGKIYRQPGDPFETFAYFGPRDIRYPVLVLAASKVGRRVLFPSLLASIEAQVHISNVSRCKTFIYGTDFEFLPNLVERIPGSKMIKAPSQEELLKDPASVPQYPYAKSFEEAKDDDVMMFHTSGSTGYPKVYALMHRMIAKADKVNNLNKGGFQICPPVQPGSRMFCSVPVFHGLGMSFYLYGVVFTDQVAVYGPSNKLVDRDVAIEIYKYGNVVGGTHPPFLVEEMLRVPEGRDLLQKSKYVCFGRAPLSKAAGDMLASWGNAYPIMGSTEGGPWVTFVPEDQRDWQYFSFHRVMSIVFDHHVGPYHELVVKRTPFSEEYTSFFDSVPSAKIEFRTKDLWSRHPDPAKSHLWKYEGRTDDLIVLSGEVKMYAAQLEERLKNCEGIQHALAGGQQRPVPFLLLEAIEAPQTEDDAARLLDKIWPAIEEHNRNVLETTQLRKELAMVAPKGRPFARVAKGAVDRRNTFKAFEQDISRLYEQAGFK
ncbi:putative AMP-binding enzyme [Phyllosticta citribraziliensis]|uniref:AMP-binding enzyme n=1 Tax=Phyllosticta citribraziliensis TaxID=989973 RepID=A0ABR1L8J8_9PEZI